MSRGNPSIVQRLCAHATGKTAIEDNEQSAGWGARTPIPQRRERDRRSRDVMKISVVRYEFVCFRSVARECDDHYIVCSHSCEFLKALPNG
jgi:hypothetical protein